MKLHEIAHWVDGDKYIDSYGKEWCVSQKELISTDGRREYIDGGRYAIGLLVNMDFTRV